MGLYNYDENFPHPDNLGDVNLYHATHPKNTRKIMQEGIKANPNTDNTEGYDEEANMTEEELDNMTEEEYTNMVTFRQPLAWTTDNPHVATENYGNQLIGVRNAGLEPEIYQEMQPDDSSYAGFGHDIDPSRLVFY